MPSAQTRPCSRGEEGRDFCVSKIVVTPQKSQIRGQASGRTPTLALGTPRRRCGLDMRLTRAQP